MNKNLVIIISLSVCLVVIGHVLLPIPGEGSLLIAGAIGQLLGVNVAPLIAAGLTVLISKKKEKFFPVWLTVFIIFGAGFLSQSYYDGEGSGESLFSNISFFDKSKVSSKDLGKIELYDCLMHSSNQSDGTLTLTSVKCNIRNRLQKPISSLKIEFNVTDTTGTLVDSFQYEHVFRSSTGLSPFSSPSTPISVYRSPLRPNQTSLFYYNMSIPRIPKGYSWSWRIVAAEYEIKD